ncbi:MAG: nitrate/nitrite transporter NrtS [Cognatishimia sp.]|uniref:nitrate/nitrite transporter NrtS n=1 Tax=Cognatishimia sp. TaxID=2211648 RepID=UPI004058552B
MSEFQQPGFFALATRRPVMRRASRIALVVGTILAIINHGDRLISGDITGDVIMKICMTYLVPYCVSTYAAVLTIRERIAEDQQNAG